MEQSAMKGQAMVEVAVILPLLLALVFGAFVLGMATQSKMIISNAAKEGCRIAAHGGSDSEVRNRVELVLSTAGLRITSDRFDRDKDITITKNSTDVTVIVLYRQPSYVPGILGGPILLRGVCVMRGG